MVVNDNQINIIPKPVKVQIVSGQSTFNNNITIIAESSLNSLVQHLVSFLTNSIEISITVLDSINNQEEFQKNSYILLQIDNSLEALGDEGYLLKIQDNSLVISASKAIGLFWGIQSFRQLLPLKKVKEFKCVNLEIEDYPRFKWRGYMLDVGRHFFSIDIVKRMIDLMALLKLNVFHWHLTEDQGWRIEIKKYPKLTEIGSKRKGTQIGRGSKKENDGIPHTGFYTQEEIKEVVKYATDRFIQVVPEIELPGHSVAALAAYPELGCTGGPYEVGTQWGVYRDVYCPGKEKIFEFWENILQEVMVLFPSEVIHIGGDEVPKDRWKECSDCQNKIKHENLKDENDLQVFVTNRISEFLAENGRRLMGWNEILDESLAPNAIGHFWKGGVEPIIKHLEKGRQFVISQNKFMYLDYPYKKISLKTAYSYEPIPSDLDQSYISNILGIEAPMWGEHIPTVQRLDYQTFPRLIAYAETAWTPQNLRNYQDFIDRLKTNLLQLNSLKVNYAPLEDVNPSFWGNMKRKFSIK